MPPRAGPRGASPRPHPGGVTHRARAPGPAAPGCPAPPRRGGRSLVLRCRLHRARVSAPPGPGVGSIAPGCPGPWRLGSCAPVGGPMGGYSER
ncbi:hypothetical protein CP979_11710 [Streptomyces filamentosus]|nr:hypothetical protein CP979_11710 [Streptomyces filamentosus]